MEDLVPKSTIQLNERALFLFKLVLLQQNFP